MDAADIATTCSRAPQSQPASLSVNHLPPLGLHEAELLREDQAAARADSRRPDTHPPLGQVPARPSQVARPVSQSEQGPDRQLSQAAERGKAPTKDRLQGQRRAFTQ